jgi:hypothetical protein
MTITVREFSAAGPCLTLGRFVRETSQFFFYDEWKGGDKYGDTKRKKKRGTLVHIAPCHSCRDHAKTQYPNGYMD